MARKPLHCYPSPDYNYQATPSDVEGMREMRLDGYLLREIAEHYNFSLLTVWKYTSCIPHYRRNNRNYVAHRRTGDAPTVSLVSLSIVSKPLERVLFYG